VREGNIQRGTSSFSKRVCSRTHSASFKPGPPLAELTLSRAQSPVRGARLFVDRTRSHTHTHAMAPPPSIQQQHNSTRCTPRAKLHQPLQCVHSHNAHATRRRALLMQGGAAAAAWAVMQLQPATARQAPIDAGVPASESAYIQGEIAARNRANWSLQSAQHCPLRPPLSIEATPRAPLCCRAAAAQ
jgi:hypothetical protein